MIAEIPDRILREIVARALAEDIGAGDITTRATVDDGAICRAQIVAKAGGVVAGLYAAEATFHSLDPAISFQFTAQDGATVQPGMTVARLEGEARAILTGERTALNFLQRMSGIATLAARYVEAVKGTKARIVDTRKTAPGLRLLDKYAVRVGGGVNHRIGLFDGVLIKDNHIRAAGGLGKAVARARETPHHLLKIEVEAQSIAQVEQALAARADVIMLDNMGVQEVRQAVALIAGRAETEASGGVTLENIRALAESGVDYISVGAITHSAPALDFSLEIGDG
jgi:nicotinate-nucleotide pyrophosphorylase (carboxylating)